MYAITWSLDFIRSSHKECIKSFVLLTEPPKATREEMKSAGLAHWQMDYCADELIDWIKCNRAVPYWPFACRDQKKAHQDCEMNESVVNFRFVKLYRDRGINFVIQSI